MTRLWQTLVVLAGLVLAAAMVVLGVWQLGVYGAQGERAARARAEAPAVPLAEVAPAGSPVGDGYGRSVRLSGVYLPEHQLALPLAGSPGRFRVLTPLRQADGSVVPVVRGTVSGADPAPPREPVDQLGVLLPSEESAAEDEAGRPTTVRVPALAQRWPGPLVGGYVTLSPADAAAQGLEPASLQLPEARGRLRNGAYALQWWVFAAFALGMAIKIARDLELADGLDAEEVEEPTSEPT